MLGAWLASARDAWARVADRPRLWIPAAVPELLGLGALPLVLAVAPPPSPADLAFLVAALIGRPDFVIRAALALAMGVVALALVLLVRAASEAIVARELADPSVGPHRSLGADSRRIWAIELLAAITFLTGLVLFGLATAGIAPAEWEAPDRGGATIVPRLIGALAMPAAFLLGSALLVYGLAAVARWEVVAAGASVRRAVAAAVKRLASSTRWTLAMVAATTLVRIAYLGASYALLRTLWRPVEVELPGGGGAGAAAVPLLLGFVFVWTCVVLGMGAVHAWTTSWWAGARSTRHQPRLLQGEPGPTWSQQRSST